VWRPQRKSLHEGNEDEGGCQFLLGSWSLSRALQGSPGHHHRYAGIVGAPSVLTGMFDVDLLTSTAGQQASRPEGQTKIEASTMMGEH